MAEIAIDTAVVQQLVEQAVKENILSTLEAMVQDSNWLAKIELLINQTATQKTFDQLKAIDIPSIVSNQINQTFDSSVIQQTVTVGVQKEIETAVANISQDPNWLSKIEKMINQAVTYQTIARISSIDINTIIKERVDENVDRFVEKLKEDFSTVGISDQASKNQMTVMDEATVFENNLVARNLHIADGAVINHLVIKGSVNTDNPAWDSLSANIQEKTLKQFSDQLHDSMVKDIAEYIKASGIDSEHINYEGQRLAQGNSLANSITQTNIQKLGLLENLNVKGTASINETLNVHRKRIGINTEEPEMALSVWDEEIAFNIGKNKLNQAYIGTGRKQGIAIGTNRVAHIEITDEGLTQIKKLQVGVHRISHDTQVPGYSGTRGDFVFNASPGNDRVFAWVCLGGYKWQPLKSAE